MGKPDREAAAARLLRIADRERAWMEEIGLPDASSIGAFLREVAEMLREQEPVKPEFDPFDGNVGRWRCGSCQVSLGAVRPPYCWHCGRKVKWE